MTPAQRKKIEAVANLAQAIDDRLTEIIEAKPQKTPAKGTDK